MVNLKTLKYITKCPTCDCIDESCVDYDCLRQEAIKWIKELKDAQIDPMKGFELCKFTAHGSDSKTNTNVINWIKHFFNITEEDLE